jgi:hypothetical protein
VTAVVVVLDARVRLQAWPMSTASCRSLEPSELDALDAALQDVPEYVTPKHLLREGYGRAAISGELPEFRGAWVDSLFEPGEPWCFGSNPEVLWELLQMVKDLDCFQAHAAVAPAVGRLFLNRNGLTPRFTDNISFVLDTQAIARRDERVRMLGPKDAQLLEAAPAELHPIGFPTPTEALKRAPVAAAVISGEIVNTAFASAFSRRYTDVGVRTLKPFRNRGLATAAASLVIDAVLRSGSTPVWASYETNRPSLAVARKLGFREAARRTDVDFPKG